MITELLIMTATTYGYRKIKSSFTHSGEKELKNRWLASMIGSGVKNKNENEETFEIVDVKETQYGYNCKIQIPFGLSYDKLESLLPTIETNMASMCELSKDKFDTYATLKIINNPLNNLQYEVPKTKAYELFLGYKYTGESFKLNMLEDTHLLIGGIRGSGKSRLIFIILTTLFKNHNENEIEVYLMELLKKDLKKFKDMPQVKMFADTITDSKLMLNRIENMIEKRSDKIESLGVENILEYNKISKAKMKYVYVFSDEYSLFMKDDSDSDIEQEEKDNILDTIKKLAKLGRSVGCFFISGLQRSTVTEINSLVKSQMCRCSFTQLSERDSENIIGITDAKGLKPQECILFTGHEYVRLKTPYIDNSIINTTLGINQVQVKDTPQEKTVLHMSWHRPTQEEWNQIKDTITEVTYVKEEVKIPTGQMDAPKKTSKRKNGVIKMSEVLKNAK
jgi:DNA segregation ATPase FtsK/SpoIIIE, S-DNA-T family